MPAWAVEDIEPPPVKVDGRGARLDQAARPWLGAAAAMTTAAAVIGYAIVWTAPI